MTNEKQPELVSIEEAVSRSIPIGGKDAIQLVLERPGFFVGTSDFTQGQKEYFADLRVDMKTYLETYDQLLKSPKRILEYVRLLDPAVIKIIETKKPNSKFGGHWDPFGEDIDNLKNSISRIFGITDHSRLNWKLSPTQSMEDIREYVKKEVMPLYDRTQGASEEVYRIMQEKGHDFCATQKGYGYYNPDGSLTDWPVLAISTSSIYPINSLPAPTGALDELTFRSEFMIPSRNDAKDIVCFDGFRETVETLMQASSIEELVFTTGDFGAFKPTYVRK